MQSEGKPMVSLRELWSWQGKVNRQRYVLVGLIGMALKIGLDRLISGNVFGYPLTLDPAFYWAPLGPNVRLQHIPQAESRYLLTMLAVALPFLWVGLAMSVKRLRDAGQPVWLAVLFFAPIVNL